MALQGDRGLSQKGPEPGNASYYYSFTRLEATGELALEGSRVPVRGTAWLDREWSTSALSPGQVGWDWFALQLDDGHDLTVYRLRRQDGSADPLSKGSWVGPGGEMRVLGAPEVELEVLERWASPLDGTLYPARWRLAVPGEELELEVVPLLSDQELALTFRYWEGAVRVTGTRRGRGVSGVGYVELTGYADAPARPAGLAPTP
jgi:predicted secreted hydrolase